MIFTVPTTRFSAIRNSSAFYFSDAVVRDWTAPQNGDLWRDSEKTLFDPCPVGWRVPKSGAGELSPWQNFRLSNLDGEIGSETTAGCRWSAVVSGGSVWYPLCGERRSNYGLFMWVTTEDDVWTTSVTSQGAYRFLMKSLSVDPSNFTVRSTAHSVRCVRE